MFDASTFTGPWAFGDGGGETLPALSSSLRRAGITTAAVSPARAILAPEPMAENRRLFAALARRARRPVRFLPVPIINPTLPLWQEHLAECAALAPGDLRAVKIVPNYHGYQPDNAALAPFMAEIARRGLLLCIQVRMVDERAQHPLMLVAGVAPASLAALATARPDLAILACGVTMAELAALAPHANIAAELSSVESGYLLRDAIGHLGTDRLLLGTHAPLYYPAAGVAKLGSATLDAAAQAQLARENFVRRFGSLDGQTEEE